MIFDKQTIESILGQISKRIGKLETGRTGIVQGGLAAERPASPTTAKGSTTTYFATDTNEYSVWNPVDEAWVSVTLT